MSIYIYIYIYIYISERIRKAFIKLFKNEFNLNIVSETNLKVVSFIDLTLNLSPINYITSLTISHYTSM